MKTKIFIFLFIFSLTNFIFSQWTQQGPKLVGTGGFGNQIILGISAAISADGNTAIVGGTGDNNNIGAAWIFIRSGNAWTQQGQKLVGTGTIGFSRQGSSVSISSDGNTAIVGGYTDNINTGAVWVFIRNNGIWTQQGSKLVGTGGVGNTYQGVSVSISPDGNTIISGGDGDNNGLGASWIFTRNGSIWTQQGQKLVGTGAIGNSLQGSSVSISQNGNTAIIGGTLDGDQNGTNDIGAAWIFIRNGVNWTQQGQKLVGSDASGPIVYQGCSTGISSDGNTAVVGGFFDNSGLGAVWVFSRNAGVWSQQGLKLVGTGYTQKFIFQGYSVAISADGNTIVEGGHHDNNFLGAAWIFARNGNVWTQQGTKLVGTGYSGNNIDQGNSVGISSNGNSVIVGGPSDNNHEGAFWIFVNPTIGILPISSEIPKSFSLSQNYPNPFNPSTKIKFQIANLSDTKLIIYDNLGREVAILVNEQLQAGTYSVEWNASNFASGIYFYSLTSEDFSQTRKMVLIK